MQQGGGTHGDPEPSRISVLFSALPEEHQLCCLDHNPNSALRTRTIALIRPRTARQLKTHLIFSPLRYCFSVISPFTAQPNSSSNYYPGTRGLGECSQTPCQVFVLPLIGWKGGTDRDQSADAPFTDRTHTRNMRNHTTEIYKQFPTLIKVLFLFGWVFLTIKTKQLCSRQNQRSQKNFLRFTNSIAR